MCKKEEKVILGFICFLDGLFFVVFGLVVESESYV